MLRQDSHHNMQDKMQVWLHRMQLSLQLCCEMLRSEPSWVLRDTLRAVLGARRPVWRLSWALRGPSRGHLERQETRPEAVLGARRAVRRRSWTPRGPSAGRLGRQEARMQVLLQFCCKMQVLRRRQPGGPLAKLPRRKRAIAEFLYRYRNQTFVRKLTPHKLTPRQGLITIFSTCAAASPDFPAGRWVAMVLRRPG